MKFYCQLFGILFFVGLSFECGQINIKRATPRTKCSKSSQRQEWIPPTRMRPRRQASFPIGIRPSDIGFFSSLNRGSDADRLDLFIKAKEQNTFIEGLKREKALKRLQEEAALKSLNENKGKAMEDADETPDAGPIPISIPIVPDNYDDRYRDQGPHLSYVPHLLKDAVSEHTEPDFTDMFNTHKDPEMHDFYATATAPVETSEIEGTKIQQELITTTLRPVYTVDPSLYAGRASGDDDDVHIEIEPAVDNQATNPTEISKEPEVKLIEEKKQQTDYKYPPFLYPAPRPAIPYLEPIIPPIPIHRPIFRPLYHAPQPLPPQYLPRRFQNYNNYAYNTPKFIPYPAPRLHPSRPSFRINNKYHYTSSPNYYAKKFRY